MLVSLAILLALTAIGAAYMYDLPAPVGDTVVSFGLGWGDSDDGTVPAPVDRALLARAKSHLKQAEIAQEIFVLDNNCYAADLESLRTADPGLPDGIDVTASSCSGFRIEVAAGDSRDTICSLDKEMGSVEYHATPSA
ncbi:MAG: hypothetical protein C4534_08635 [Gaiellales bacterium]|nr:MAG: hypothetical protein C4534_08635 [Gaiellales bacterium]